MQWLTVNNDLCITLRGNYTDQLYVDSYSLHYCAAVEEKFRLFIAWSKSKDQP